VHVLEVGGHPCQRANCRLVRVFADTGRDLSPDLLDVILDRMVRTPSFSRQLEEPTVSASEPCAADELVDKLAKPVRIVTLEQAERRLELPEQHGRRGDRVQQLPASSRQAVRGELFLERVLDQPVEVLEPVADRTGLRVGLISFSIDLDQVRTRVERPSPYARRGVAAADLDASRPSTMSPPNCV
jgi:hypothetical protein